MKPRLIPSFSYSADQRERCLEPLLRELLKQCVPGKTFVAGIHGGQGTGKTTLTRYLAGLLSEEGRRVVSCSLDDFYSSHNERKRLAAQHPGNPFYQIPRGLPGTHRTRDMADALSCLRRGEDVDLPIFDKSAHDGQGDISGEVVKVRERQDIVLFEGWCIGLPEATPGEVLECCRRQRLQELVPLPAAEHLQTGVGYLGAYQPSWKQLDLLVMLRPDELSLHLRWRSEQERQLIRQTGAGMSEAQVIEMVRQFLPFTCLGYETLKPDLRLRINGEHTFYKLEPGATLCSS